MTIDYHKLKAWHFDDIESVYSKRDTILYALGIGLGSEATNPEHLRYVYEGDLQAFPTLAVTLGYPGLWVKDPGSGIDWVKMLHGEQSLKLHKAFPVEGTVVGRNRVSAIIDKGAGRGALLVVERELFDKANGDLLATLESVSFCRGDGGFSSIDGQASDEPRAAPPTTPHRAPDTFIDITTRPEAALIYRLAGDMNPVHADPEVAKAAGFDRPILHGLASFGIAGRALLQGIASHASGRLSSIRARFSAPVYPGDTIRTEIWFEKEEMFFLCMVLEREITVLSNGHATLEAV